MSKGEAWIVFEILRAYGAHPRIRLWRSNTGVAKMGDRSVRFGVPGQSDITGILNMGPRFGGVGVALFIEAKTATGRQSPAQVAFQKMCERTGALYILARSTDDVRNGIAAFIEQAGARLAAETSL